MSGRGCRSSFRSTSANESRRDAAPTIKPNIPEDQNMSQHDIRSAERPEPDQVLVDIADYVCEMDIDSDLAYETAHYCLMDTLACGFPGAGLPGVHETARPGRSRRHATGRRARARQPRTNSSRSMAAFNIGAMIRWLDFNDTWLAGRVGASVRQPGGASSRPPITSAALPAPRAGSPSRCGTC